MKNSRHYIHCNAPMCVEDKQSWTDCIWYPDEDICNLKIDGITPDWIKMQKKVAKATRQNPEVGFFTLKMLQRNCVVGSNMQGLNSDKLEYEKQEKDWFRKHPAKRKLTNEERAEKRERFEKAVLSKRNK